MVKPRDFLRDVAVTGTPEEVAAEAELLGAMLRSCTAGEEL
jgi:hypothetical protein